MKMMKPLNTFVYIRNNPKKIIPQIFAVSLGVFLVYFICMIGGGIKTELSSNITAPYRKMTEVYVKDPQKDNNEFYDYFSKNSNVEKIMYSSDVGNITAKVLINESGSYCPYLREDDIRYMMNMYNFKLSAGRLPQSNNEVLFNENYAISRKLKIGDYYGTDVNEKDDLNGKYKLVGTFKSDIIMSFVYDNESVDEMKKHPYALTIIAKEGRLDALNKDIKNFADTHPNQYNYDDYNEQYSFISTMFIMFNIFAVVILGITVFVITFTISDINYVHFCERLPEFSMLEALGYNKSAIKRKQISEMVSMNFLGFIFGFMLSLLGGYIFNEIYCMPNGIPIWIVSPWYILLSGLVPVLVSLFSCIFINKHVNRMQSIDVLEGRI